MQKQVTTFPLSTVNIITSYLEKAIFIDNTANLMFLLQAEYVAMVDIGKAVVVLCGLTIHQ